MLCSATQDGWVMVKSSDKTWFTGKGNGNPLQYSCRENPMDSVKSVAVTSVYTHSPSRTHPLPLWDALSDQQAALSQVSIK